MSMNRGRINRCTSNVNWRCEVKLRIAADDDRRAGSPNETNLDRPSGRIAGVDANQSLFANARSVQLPPTAPRDPFQIRLAPYRQCPDSSRVALARRGAMARAGKAQAI